MSSLTQEPIPTMDSFRCIHASRLLLDHQLHGTGTLAADVRNVVEDATFIGFEKIIDACLVHEVDCLLLAGESIDPANKGLRGPAALVRGIQRLAERDIPVILDAGDSNRWSNWPPGLRFPPNAHRLGTGFESSVSIARSGRLLATITAAETPSGAHRDITGWQIQLPEAHGTTRTFPLHDDPGPAQGIDRNATGSHGCVLLEFDGDSAPRQTVIATAPVRWESFEISVADTMSRDDLLQEMASILERTSRKPCEKVWLVGWNVSGDGELAKALLEARFCDELAADLAELVPLPGISVHTHSLRVQTSSQSVRSIKVHDELATEFVARLEERFARPTTALQECLMHSALRAGPWEMKMETLLAELDAGEVAHDACRMAMHWFGAPEELSS